MKRVRSKRLFVALPISEKIKKKIEILTLSLKDVNADLKLVPVENMHFTLKFLGDIPEEKINEIKQKLSSLAEKCKSFSVNITQLGVFPSLKKVNVIWVGTENKELISLMNSLNNPLNYLRKNEYDKDIPHLTLARVKSEKNKEKLRRWVEQFKNLDWGEMGANKMILFESQLTLKGPVYIPLEEFILKG